MGQEEKDGHAVIKIDKLNIDILQEVSEYRYRLYSTTVVVDILYFDTFDIAVTALMKNTTAELWKTTHPRT